MRRHHYAFHIVERILPLTEMIGEMAEFDSRHEFVETYSIIFSCQHLLCKIRIRVLFLQKVHKLSK